VHQGNIISAVKIAEIQPGMSFEQVRYVLGTPLLQDIFHADRWDYIYIEKPGYKPETRHHVAIYFTEGRVDRIVIDPVLTAENA
jgi:outer membrane protein assembly factor BamE (lipoprotein component of BamABCDE complex)